MSNMNQSKVLEIKKNIDDIVIDNQMQNQINYPRSSNSNSNDISKLNSSFLSSIDLSKRTKNSIQKDKNVNIIHLGNEIESISNEEISEERKGSNSFYDRGFFYEINRIERENKSQGGGW
jgi:hypothetical protein